jgi:hypothetical protein
MNSDTTVNRAITACANCGAAVAGGRFCPQCGQAVAGTLEPDAPQVTRAAPLTTPPPNGPTAPLQADTPDGVQPASPPPDAPGGSPRWLPWAGAAVAALAAAAVVLSLTVLSGGKSAPTTPRASAVYQHRVAAAFAPVLDANREVSATLATLHGTRPRSAQHAVSRAQTATSIAQGTVNALGVPAGQQQLGVRARQALDREASYVTSVSATLIAPSNPGAGEGQALASNLTAALNDIEPPVNGGAQTVSGATDLAGWAQHIVRRQTREQQLEDQRQANAAAAATGAAAYPRPPALGAWGR